MISKTGEKNVEQSQGENQLQKEEKKSLNINLADKILGVILLFLTLFWTYLGFYDFLTFGIDITSFQIPLYVFSYIIGIALLLIHKRGFYNKLLFFCGGVLSTFYLLVLIIYIIFP